MLDGLPLEVVVRIGELGRWNERTFLALSQVSKIYRKTVQGLHPFAQRFDLRNSGWTNADDVPLTIIARQWFTKWSTCNPQVARRLGSIAYSLTFNGSHEDIKDRDVSALGDRKSVV